MGPAPKRVHLQDSKFKVNSLKISTYVQPCPSSPALEDVHEVDDAGVHILKKCGPSGIACHELAINSHLEPLVPDHNRISVRQSGSRGRNECRLRVITAGRQKLKMIDLRAGLGDNSKGKLERNLVKDESPESGGCRRAGLIVDEGEGSGQLIMV